MFSFYSYSCLSGYFSCKQSDNVNAGSRWQQPAMQQILQHQPELAHKLLFVLA